MKTKKVLSAVLCAVLALLLLADVALIAVPKLMGMNAYAINSGSMSPAIHKGDLVLTKDVDFLQIKPNDMICVRDKRSKLFFTHRVVSVDVATNTFVTKGDANNFNDPAPTSYTYVMGRVEHTVKGLGYVHLALVSPYGLAFLFAIAVMWLITEIYFVRKRKHEEA